MFEGEGVSGWGGNVCVVRNVVWVRKRGVCEWFGEVVVGSINDRVE